MNRDRSARLLRWCCVLVTWLAGSPLFAQSLPFWLAPGKPSPVATLPYVYEYPPTLVPEHDAWVWGDAEYLLQWIKATSVPALVTTGPPSSVGPSGAPAPGAPGTAVVLGGNTLNGNVSNGGRFRFGFWLIDDQWFGIECSSFFLTQQKTQATVSSSGLPALSIPFFNVLTGTPDSTSIASSVGPVSFSGVANLTVQTQLVGVDPNFVFLLCNNKTLRLDFLAGWRWIKLDDTLDFQTNSANAPPASLGYFATQDRFQVHNNFYGAQLGLRSEWCWNSWLLHASGKIALGDCQETVRYSGGTATDFLTGFGTVQTFPGGYLTLPSNLQSWRRDVFTVVPEFNLKLGYAVANCCKVYVGYSVLYMSSVARAAGQIDPEINPSQGGGFGILTPQTRPNNGLAFPTWHGSATDFWAQGVTAGVEFRF